MKWLKRFFTEYLSLNIFIFIGVWLLSLIFVNLSLFDPLAQAFQDFSLTDLYYTRVKDKNDIYKGPIVLINSENKNRKEISFLLQRIEEGHPKVIGLDMIFAHRQTQEDSLLKKQFAGKSNYVFAYDAHFDNENESVYTDTFFTKEQAGYANMEGETRENSTIRNYFQYTDQKESFTSLILKKYDSSLYQLLQKKNRKLEIHYSGNLGNFQYYDFDDVMNPSFDAAQLTNKIILVGYLGLPQVKYGNMIDEDKFFTPLNKLLSGRSHPDMYGCVIHANILHMVLEKDFVKVIPRWTGIIISFLIIWLLLPLFGGLFFKGDLWFNGLGTFVQLIGSIFLSFLTVMVYRVFNIKFDPGLLMTCFVLLPTFINVYEAFIKFLHYKLKLKLSSRFTGDNEK